MLAQRVHRVEVGGRILVGLAAGEEDDPRHRRGNVPLEAADRLNRDLFVRRLLRALVAREDHVRLQQDPLWVNTLVAQLGEHGVEGARRDLEAALERVVAVHQHFGLDDRDEPGFLRQRGVARECVGVRPDAVLARNPLADRDHGAPLREACTQPAVLFEPVPQTVESLRDRLALRERERLGARVDFDPRDHALGLEQLREGGSVRGALANRLVEEDHAADVLLDALCGEQQVSVRPPVLLGRLHPD